MATPTQLKSGNWRVQVFSHVDENGKKKYVSFTAPTKAEARRKANEFLDNKEPLTKNYIDMTVRQALEKYVATKEHVISPSSFEDYSRRIYVDYKSIERLKLSDLDNVTIQAFINEHSARLSPKSVRTIYGLLHATLKMFLPHKSFVITMPQKEVLHYNLPSDDDVAKMLQNADPDLRLAITLASVGTLRRSEICGLTYKDVLYDMNAIHVHSAMVKKKGGGFIHKQMPKKDSSDRVIQFPKRVIEMIGQGEPDEYIYKHTPNALTSSFERLVKKQKLNCRFHDLRHYAASTLHALNIPDQYIMERGGWSSDTVLKTVYRNTLKDKSIKFNKEANNYFEKALGV